MIFTFRKTFIFSKQKNSIYLMLFPFNNIIIYQTSHPPHIGWSIDGYSIFGRHISNSNEGEKVALDMCGGHSHKGYSYHYHTQVHTSRTNNGVAVGGDEGVTYQYTTPGPFKCFKGEISSTSIPKVVTDVATTDATLSSDESTYACMASNYYYTGENVVLPDIITKPVVRLPSMFPTRAPVFTPTSRPTRDPTPPTSRALNSPSPTKLKPQPSMVPRPEPTARPSIKDDWRTFKPSVNPTKKMDYKSPSPTTTYPTRRPPTSKPTKKSNPTPRPTKIKDLPFFPPTYSPTRIAQFKTPMPTKKIKPSREPTEAFDDGTSGALYRQLAIEKTDNNNNNNNDKVKSSKMGMSILSRRHSNHHLDAVTFPPTKKPVSKPPTVRPSSGKPSYAPSGKPSYKPSIRPKPTYRPSRIPTPYPTMRRSNSPSPSKPRPSPKPVLPPTGVPTTAPTGIPSISPTFKPRSRPTQAPTESPSKKSKFRTEQPTSTPSDVVTQSPTRKSRRPTSQPTSQPSSMVYRSRETREVDTTAKTPPTKSKHQPTSPVKTTHKTTSAPAPSTATVPASTVTKTKTKTMMPSARKTDKTGKADKKTNTHKPSQAKPKAMKPTKAIKRDTPAPSQRNVLSSLSTFLGHNREVDAAAKNIPFMSRYLAVSPSRNAMKIPPSPGIKTSAPLAKKTMKPSMGRHVQCPPSMKPSMSLKRGQKDNTAVPTKRDRHPVRDQIADTAVHLAAYVPTAATKGPLKTPTKTKWATGTPSTATPTYKRTSRPSSAVPTRFPTAKPYAEKTAMPSEWVSMRPTVQPQIPEVIDINLKEQNRPSYKPSVAPYPTDAPVENNYLRPTVTPSRPTAKPSRNQHLRPTGLPTFKPSGPSISPSRPASGTFQERNKTDFF